MKRKNTSQGINRRDFLGKTALTATLIAAGATVTGGARTPAAAASADPVISLGSDKVKSALASTVGAGTATHAKEMALAVPAYDIMWKTAAERKRVINLIKGTGVTWVRTDLWLESLTWDGPHQVDWATPDVVINDLRKAGIKIILVIHTLPKYAGVTNPRVGPTTQKQRNIYISFVKKAVERYKDRVKHWEIWNEPNLTQFWGKPNIKDYGTLLSQVYPVIKKADPSAVVISGGTGGKGQAADIDAMEFLRGLYATQNLKKSCDAVGIHAYADMTQPNIGEFFRLPQYRALMDKNGDRAKKLWITEGGAAVKPGNAVATEANQTGMMPQLADAWARTSNRGPLCWFSLFNNDGCGVVKGDRTTKRASYYTLQYLTSRQV